jgi:hypothetical protein
MVDSQEYKDILNKIAVEGNSTTISQILSTYDKNIAINDAVIQQAEAEVPKSGFDVEHIFELKEFTTTDDLPSADDIGITADDTGESKSTDTTGAPINASNDSATTQNTEQRVEGYLTQAIFDGTIGSGLSFPASPAIGDHYLRIDFLPNRLFKYDGKRWVKQVDDLRTNITNNASGNQTQRASFMRNNTTYVDPADSTNTLQERQSLSKAFTPKADNNG